MILYGLSLIGGLSHACLNYSRYEWRKKRNLEPFPGSRDNMPWEVGIFSAFTFLGLLSLVYMLGLFLVKFFEFICLPTLDDLMDRFVTRWVMPENVTIRSNESKKELASRSSKTPDPL